MSEEIEQDELTLKWGTLKAWHFRSLDDNPELNEALDFYNESVSQSVSAMAQDRTGLHNEALCKIIDAVRCDEIYLDWDGKYVSKEEAKKYVNEYGNR